MSKSREKEQDRPQEQQSAEAAAEKQSRDASEQAEDASADGAPANEWIARVDELENELAELKNRYLRSVADYQNLARRSEQSAQAAREQQLIDMVRSLMPALDQFDQALELDPEKTDAEAIMSGIRMVRDELSRAMQAHRIERFDAEIGEEFDANRHEALLQQPVEGVESNCVTMQMQPGYAVAGKTVRPAKVAVAP